MNETEQHLFDPDQPLVDPKDDRLKRDGFSEELAAHIGSWGGKESIVISINGDWGTGKSTVKNFVQHHLAKREPKPTTIEFNPWEWSGQKKILEGFLNEIGIALGKQNKGKKYRDLAKKWKRYASYVQFSASIGQAIKTSLKSIFTTSLIVSATTLSTTSTIGNLVFIIGLVVAVISGALIFIPSLLNALVKLFTDQAAFHERSMKDLKDDLSKDLATLKSPVVIFLDDVDRLTDEEIKILFQLVKANCQFPNLIYVVLFERDIVEAALEKIVSGGGKRYLRKIVQHSFDLPYPSSVRLQEIIGEDLDNALFKSDISGIQWNRERWQGEFSNTFFSWFSNIRDAKRFVGSLKFVLARHSSEGVLEVDPIDLVIVEALRVMHYDVYRRIAEGFHAQGSSNSILFGDDDQKNRFHTQVESIVESFADQPALQAPMRSILEGLFPQSSEDSRYYEGSEETWLRDRRVCHPNFFQVYFQLTLEDGGISAALLDQVLSSSGNGRSLSKIFNTAKKEGNILDLLQGILVNRDRIPTENLETFVTTIFNTGDDLPDDADTFLLVDSEVVCLQIIHHRLKLESQGVRDSVLLHAYKHTTGIVIPVRFLFSEEKTKRSTGDRHTESLIPNSLLPDLRGMALELIRNRAQDQSLLNLRKSSAILFRWKHWASEEEVKTWTSSVVQEPKAALTLLIKSLSTSYGSSGKKYWLNGKSAESLVDLDALLTSINALDHSEIDDIGKDATKLLLLAIERRDKEQNYEEVRLNDDW